MAQNRSHAVMAQRSEPHDSLDDFPTPPWGGRALCEMLTGRGHVLKDRSCWEPAANRGYLVRGFRDYFEQGYGSDIYDYGAGYEVRDFLFPGDWWGTHDYIGSNPPFRLALEFTLTALERARDGVAMLCRTQFSESVGRYKGVFRDKRPSYVMQFVERLPMVKGRVDPDASTATAYAWYVWLKSRPAVDTIYDWIPPCRKRLERPGDYLEDTAK